jgi:hypothetical protein
MRGYDENLEYSHGRGHMFDPCITHQNLLNKIKGLEVILGPFSMILSSIGRAYYKSYIFLGVFIDFRW